MTARFEAAWAAWNGAGAVATASWTGRRAGGAGVRRRARRGRAVPVEHVHGHAARDPGRRRAPGVRGLQPRRPVRVAARRRGQAAPAPAEGRRPRAHRRPRRVRRCRRSRTLCAAEGVFLIEDCAHAHGARWDGRRPGTWGDAGVYSFYATKTVSTGRGRRARLAPRRRARVRARLPQLRQARPPRRGPELPDERVHRRAGARTDRAHGGDRRAPRTRSAREHLDPRPSRPAPSCPTGWSPGSTSTSSSTRSSARRARSTPSRATGSWAPATTCPTATGSASTTGARRSTTAGHERSARIMRVLVTGGAGFIGSHVVDRLLATPVTAAHLRRAPVRPPRPRRGRRRASATCSTARRCRRAMRGCDAVVHLAAAADVDDVAQRPAEAEEVNARGTLNVLEAARSAGVARVVYASDDLGLRRAPTGDGRRGHTRSSCPITSTRRPSSPARCTAAPTRRSTACECTVLRFGIPYGPRARPAAVIPIFVRKALAGEPLTIAGERRQSRRFVYVEDLAEGVVRSLAPQAAGRIYNLVGDESVTVRADRRHGARRSSATSTSSTPRPRTADFAGAEVSGARAARRARLAPGDLVRRGRAPLRRLAPSRRGATGRAAPRRGSGACAAGRGVAPPVRLGRALVADGVRGGRRARRLPGRGPRGRRDRRLRSHRRRARRQHARRRYLGDGARRPAPRAVDLRGLGARRRRPGPRLHARVPRGPAAGRPRRVAGPARPGRRLAGGAPSPTSACGCAAAATSAWPRTAPRASAQSEARARDGLEHRAAARARCARHEPGAL